MKRGLAAWLHVCFYLSIKKTFCFWLGSTSLNEAGSLQILPETIPGLWKLGSNQRSYLISEDAMPFYDAKDFCTEQAAELASITNEIDQEAVEHMTSDDRIRNRQPFWLGLYETIGTSNSEWSWLKRNVIAGMLGPYTNWENDVGQLGDPLRDCAAMGVEGTWIIKNCDDKAKAICQSNAKRVSAQPTGTDMNKIETKIGPVSSATEYADKLLKLFRPANSTNLEGGTTETLTEVEPMFNNTGMEKWTTDDIFPAEKEWDPQEGTEAYPSNLKTTKTMKTHPTKNSRGHAEAKAGTKPVLGSTGHNLKSASKAKNSQSSGSDNTSSPSRKDNYANKDVRCALLNFLNHYGKSVKILRVVNDKEAKSIYFNESNYRLKTIFKRIANVRRMKPVEYYAIASETGQRLLLDGMKSLPLIPGDCKGEFMDVIITDRDRDETVEDPESQDPGVIPNPSPHTVAGVTKPTEKMSSTTRLTSPPIPNDEPLKPSDEPTKRPVKRSTHHTYFTITPLRTINTATAFKHSTVSAKKRTFAREYDKPMNKPTAKSCKLDTFGGNADGDCCRFPFKYNNIMHYDCTKTDSHHSWCATTHNYDKDKAWGYCCLGNECI